MDVQSFTHFQFLYGVTYGNGVFVAVGQSGTILTSPDGLVWTDNTPTTSSICLYGVTFGGDAFVAVGDTGTVLSSPDHVTWTKKTTSVPNALRAITYVNNTFVAVGSGGKILTSATLDGSTWTSKTSGIVYSLAGIDATPQGQLVAVGSYATILSSDDALAWTVRSSGTYKILRGIARGKGKFVAVGDGGTILSSTNGSTWDVKTLTGVAFLNGIAFGNGLFVAVGGSSVGTTYYHNMVFTSPDGVTLDRSDPLARPSGLSRLLSPASGRQIPQCGKIRRRQIRCHG